VTQNGRTADSMSPYTSQDIAARRLSGAELERRGRQPQLPYGGAHHFPLGGQLPERRPDEDADPLVRSPDRRR
jgi:hypothetical protein